MERLEAFTHVTLKMDTKTADGARLTYHAADEQYVMAGAGAVPVRVVVRTAATASAPQACRETTGRTLTFKKATDNIEVDGKDETRIDTRPITCPPQTSR